jgi:3-hydroxybutyrate dehydrogenase
MNGFGDAAEIAQVVAEVEGLGAGTVVYDAADMSKPDQIVAMIVNAEARFGSVDVLVYPESNRDARKGRVR